MDTIYRTMGGLYRTFIDGPFELIIAALIVTAAGSLGYDPGRMTAEPWKAEPEEPQSAAPTLFESDDAPPGSRGNVNAPRPMITASPPTSTDEKHQSRGQRRERQP